MILIGLGANLDTKKFGPPRAALGAALQEIEKNYRINVKDFKKYLDENAYKTFTNQYAENKNIQLEFDQYVESLLKDQKYIIEKVNKNNPQNGNTVYYSINLKRILDNAYKYLEDLIRRNGKFFNNCVTNFSILYSNLNSGLFIFKF